MSAPDARHAPAPEGTAGPEPAFLRPTGPDYRDLVSRTSLIGIWLLVAAGFAIFESDLFLQEGTFKTIFGAQFELVFLAVALICTFTVGEFDLSVASSMGLSGSLVPLLAVQDGLPIVLAVALALAAAAGVGVVNGILVVRIGVDPIVATLGMGTLVLGITLWATSLNVVNGLSHGFSELALRDVLGLPIAFFYGLAACLLLAYVLGFTPLGRRMAFVGSSREVARLAGINVNRLRFGAYVAGGLIAGVAGVLLASTLGGYDPNTSSSYLLPAFAAVFLGTAVVQPGRFNPLGAFIAVYFLQTGIVGLQLAGLTGWVENVFYGGALVLAVATTTVIRRKTGR
ncbi:MAG: ABC transporter permease [Actinobacteria bacterium]|nr:ABC transporter permease [Actinomycetota bacterium]